MPPVLDADAAVADIRDGSVVMIGGFSGGGQPFALVEALVRQGARDLTIIANNITLNDNNDMLVANGQVRAVIASFPVPATRDRHSPVEAAWRAGTLRVETVPQGTLAERIRAGGAGIGGFYTPTGVGTVAAEGKETRTIDGREYVLEHPLRADVALIRAQRADQYGNLLYRHTSRNFNPVMATAADLVIALVDEIVETLDPDSIVTPGLYVDRLVCA